MTNKRNLISDLERAYAPPARLPLFSGVTATPATLKVPLPERMQGLAYDAERGYIVPFFVAYVDGKPDFRVMDPRKRRACIVRGLCWLCGGPLEKELVFTIGPMCALNRVSAEPPSHLECARYAVQVCPFLTKPKMKRNEHEMPEGAHDPGGLMITRNPGAYLLWSTHSYKIFTDGGQPLCKVGEPLRLEWWAQGRLATKQEVLDSIESGLPILRESAEKDGPEALAELERVRVRGMKLVDWSFGEGSLP